MSENITYSEMTNEELVAQVEELEDVVCECREALLFSPRDFLKIERRVRIKILTVRRRLYNVKTIQ